MSVFNIALSGLGASSKDLDVTSNNIANAETVGFKKSRAEFADVYAMSLFGKSRTQAGSGVNVAAVTQQFSQGNLTATDNSLDLGVSGQGFFVLKSTQDSKESVYTRAGQFQVNKDGYIVNSMKQYLQGFSVESTTGAVMGTSNVTPIKIDSTFGSPKATTAVNLAVNLDSSAIAPTTAWDPLDVAGNNHLGTYNSTTSELVYDSMGNQHTVSYYFAKDSTVPTPATWNVYTEVDGFSTAKQPAAPSTGTVTTTDGKLVFDTAGKLDTINSIMPDFTWTGMPGGAADMPDGTNPAITTIKTAFTNTTQFSIPFQVTAVSQDGFAAGDLTGLEIDKKGLVLANYSNGQSKYLGKVALASFANPQGLRQLGDTNWQKTMDSGDVLLNEAGTGVSGLINSGSLEQSNVDLTSELVHLIIAQRDFQANAKSIETANQLTQTIINLR